MFKLDNKLGTILALLILLVVPAILLFKYFGAAGLGPLTIIYAVLVVFGTFKPDYLNFSSEQLKVIPKLDRAREVLGRDTVLFYPPKYGTEDSAGIDLALQYPIVIKDKALRIDFCFAAKIPKGHGAFILPRSSKGNKEGISQRNAISLFDSDFPGNWTATITLDDLEVILDEDFDLFEDYQIQRRAGGEVVIAEGTYLFQAVILPYNKVNIELYPEHFNIGSVTRNKKGHGSTDINPQEGIRMNRVVVPEKNKKKRLI